MDNPAPSSFLTIYKENIILLYYILAISHTFTSVLTIIIPLHICLSEQNTPLLNDMYDAIHKATLTCRTECVLCHQKFR
jgi:hypothetical protein